MKVKEDGKKREGREGIGCCSWCAWTGGRDGECVEVSPVKRRLGEDGLGRISFSYE